LLKILSHAELPELLVVVTLLRGVSSRTDTKRSVSAEEAGGRFVTPLGFGMRPDGVSRSRFSGDSFLSWIFLIMVLTKKKCNTSFIKPEDVSPAAHQILTYKYNAVATTR